MRVRVREVSSVMSAQTHNVCVTCRPDWRGPGPAFQRVVRLDKVYAWRDRPEPSGSLAGRTPRSKSEPVWQQKGVPIQVADLIHLSTPSLVTAQ